MDPEGGDRKTASDPDPEPGQRDAGGSPGRGGLASRIDALLATSDFDEDEVSVVEELSADDIAVEAEAPLLGGGRPERLPTVTVPSPPPPRPPSARMPAIPSAPATPPATPPARMPTKVIAVPPIPATPPPPPRSASRPVVKVPPLVEARPAPPARADVEADEDSAVSIDVDDAIEPGVRPPDDAPAVPRDDGDDDAAPLEPVVAADVALETQLEQPTVLDRALADIGEAVHEQRAAELAADAEAATGDRATIAGLHYELGELYERRLADEARAVKAFGKALATDPSLRPNLWAIRRIFYRRGLWPNLQKLLDAELRFARTDAERAELLLEKGLLLRDRLDLHGEARAALEESARLDPGQLSALVALERMALADGDLAGAAELSEELARRSRAPERKLVHLLELIRFYADAGPAGLERAGELIAEAVALGVDAERVAEERLRIAELSGEPDEILAALEAQAAIAQNQAGPAGAFLSGREPLGAEPPAHGRAPGTPLDRGAALRLRIAAIRRRQAQVARGAGMGERAWDYLQRAVAVAPGEPLLLADLADLAEELGRFDELAELVQSWQSLEGDPARAATLSIRRADALLRGGQREAARGLLASLDATMPGFLPVSALIERDAIGHEDWVALATAWTRAAEAARLGALLGPGTEPDPLLAASLYVAAAELWAHEVAPRDGVDPDAEARAALGHALEVVRGYPPAIEALVELHERAGRVDEAAAVLELQAESPATGDLDARVQVLARLARLYRDHALHEQALAAELKLRRLVPDDVGLLWQVDVSLAQLGGAERVGDRIANLQAIAARDPDPARRGIALATAARLAEDAGDRDRAIELYRAVLAAWPQDRYARAALVELLRAQERWEELVTQRRAEAIELADGPGAIRALREAAWVLEERLGRPGDAAAVYRELLDRVPDEASAALGLIRTRAAAGDALGLVAALEARLESLGGAEPVAIAGAAVTLATAHEAAGRIDDAIDAYRRAIEAGRDGAAASAVAIAAIALADVAVSRGDHVARAEAYQAIAAATASGTIAAALHEDLAWLQALVLEDFDAAAQSFAEAARVDPTARGPLTGGLLVAARRGDRAGLAAAAAALAASTTQPDAAAALHLRVAALASAVPEDEARAAGLPSPDESVARARAVAPDDVGALVVAAERAALAPPPPATGGPGEDAQRAIDALLARAELFALRAQLADDPASRGAWELDRAEALEAAGRLKEAGMVVAGVLRALPGDLRALEALRRLARRGGDRATLGRATVALARRLTDPAARVELLREAAAIFDPGSSGAEPGVDAEAAVGVYKRILADDPGAPDFERLVALYRQAGDLRGLHLAIDERVAYLDRAEPADRVAAVPLLLERARLKKTLGNPRGAAADLDDVLGRDPEHLDALRAAADVAAALGDAPRAVELWRRYLAKETSPAHRSAAELALSKLLAEAMGDTAGAIVELERVIATSPDDAALRERLIGLATRAGDWQRVARELRELARLRPSPGEKAKEELRLAEVQRDKLGDRPAARATLVRARTHAPFDLDVIEPLIALTDDRAQRQRLLADLVAELRGAIEQAPARATFFERLAAVAGWQGDREVLYWAAQGVEALGTPTADHRLLLSDARKAPAALSRAPLDPARRAALRPAHAGGVLADVWRAIGGAVTGAQGLDPGKLGVTRADKQSVKDLVRRAGKWDALATVLAIFGIDDVELYVAESRPGLARVLSGETPVVCLGGDVAAAATAQARYWLGRCAMLAVEGTGTLAELKEPEAFWYLAAAARVVDAPVPPGLADAAAQDGAAIPERARLLGKHLSRRDKKALAALAPQLGAIAQATDVAAWRRAALSAAHRAGLLVAGDLAPTLDALDVRGARAIADAPHAADLLAWSVSEAHLELRRHLGLARVR